MYPVRSLVTTVVLSVCFFSISSAASSLSRAHCDSTVSWDLLDLNGDASLRVEEDSTVPVGYGPKVLHLEGNQALLLAKGVHLKEGTLLVLWKDIAPLKADADGILLFGADYGDDLTEAHNTKQVRHHFWVEQDDDKGFQIKEGIGKDNDRTLIELPGTGLIQDPWNKNGWIWQKIFISGGILRAKFWSFVDPEPEKWQIEIPSWKPEEGRVGLKVWSGRISIASFMLAQADIHVSAPTMELSVNLPVCYALERLKASVFFNQAQPVPGATVSLKVASATGEQETTLKKDLPAGSSEAIFGASGETIHFPESMPPGKVTLTAALLNASGTGIGHATRAFEYRSVKVFKKRIEEIRKNLERLNILPWDPEYVPLAILEATSARAHIGLAEQRLNDGKESEAEKSLAYAEEAIAWIKEGSKEDWEQGKDWTSGNFESEKILARICPIKTDSLNISADSMVMGETYEVGISWHSYIGIPTETLTARVTLTDDIAANTPVSVDIPLEPGAWSTTSQVQTSFHFRLPEEFPSGRTQPIELPSIREGYHRLWLSLHHPDGSAVWLDMPDPEAGSYKDRYQIARVYVTQNPVEIRKTEVTIQEGDPTTLKVPLRNTGVSPLHSEVTASILTECGTVIWTDIRPVDFAPKGSTSLTFDFSGLMWFGNLTFKIEVSSGQTVLTRMEQPLAGSHNGEDDDVALRPLVHTELIQIDGKPVTRIVIGGPPLYGSGMTLKATVRQEGGIITEQTLRFPHEQWEADKQRPNLVSLEVEPSLGAYHLTLTATQEQDIWWSTEIPVIAPVFENRDGKLFLNGEPFIVKGVNVHGMIGHSPERNRQMLRFLKDIGFNTLRGDFPPPWQIEMAEEENLGYMALPPFSVNSTDYYKKLYSLHPFPKMREITRRFIKTYRDKPGLWFWNSCNEVTGEITDLLVSVYPLYKMLDPAQRPVLYANLYGQNETLGQDLMAGNCYFGVGQDAASVQPLIDRGIDVARKAGLPCIFTEFNCWYGPVYSRGVEAVEGLYEYGLGKGMAGGCLYLLAEDPDRHPAVIASRDNLWTNPTFIAALHHAFDDAGVVPISRTDGIQLEVKNRRDFWLRKVRYEIKEGNRPVAEGTLEDIAPHGSGMISLDGEDKTKAHVYEATVWFETHHGLRGQVRNRVLVGGKDTH